MMKKPKRQTSSKRQKKSKGLLSKIKGEHIVIFIVLLILFIIILAKITATYFR